MKKFLSLVLSLVFCLSLSPSVLAADNPSADEGAARCVFLTEEECAAFNFQEAGGIMGMEEEIDPIDPQILDRVEASIVEIIAYPLLADVTDPSQARLFYYTHIGKKVTYTTFSQSRSMNITRDEAHQLYQLANNYLFTNEAVEGHQYMIVGWYMETLVQLRSSKPKYIEYRIAEPNFGAGTGYTKANIPYTAISYRIKGACQFPSSFSDTERYVIPGIEGSYYYGLDNGNVLGIPFRASLIINA